MLFDLLFLQVVQEQFVQAQDPPQVQLPPRKQLMQMSFVLFAKVV